MSYYIEGASRQRGENAPFWYFFNRQNAAAEAQSSPTGNEIHTPVGPKKRVRMKLNGIVITNWRSKEMIREFRPFPIASNTPE